MASHSSNSRASHCSHPSSERNTLLCKHGIKPVLRVSRTKENPGRRFWDCANYQVKEGCNFFVWADSVYEEEDAKKVKLRKKVGSLKLKVKEAEMKMKAAAVVGIIECMLLLILWLHNSASSHSMLCP
ncbi:hypothetical protein PIB30_084111 [Stylosanthes scabra]|uniref:GRF-type domain-containing protein n=1 Tax=Stylosanthes scabra TaxID=79078 RepID=A0ABU6RT25_9FABA|nr:hypothetical protein [Stylosanthes scabra]